MIVLVALLGIAGLAAMVLVLLYNRLVRLRNMVREGWSGIEVQLKRRSNLIPNLVESVKGYMGHERGVLETVSEMRSRSLGAADVSQKQVAENALSAGLARLFAVAENYPELKADRNFQDLQNQLAEIEDQIQLARRYYNGTVRNLNIAVESFPGNLVAGGFGFQPAVFFENEDPGDRAVPKVTFN
ncbi:Protein LemA [Desulfosarcina cetonica]|uniref:LemA family protein n=1 Tax=Desulfosarcina cetonica TaxID=90730 RepID=UPI0006D2AD8B|nr:LemA family protein [Desulfosarcina cetonica]VTR68449.1 Protein LemA [Desulfosarcina cetonica]